MKAVTESNLADTLDKLLHPAVDLTGFQLPSAFMNKCIDNEEHAIKIWDRRKTDYEFLRSQVASEIFARHRKLMEREMTASLQRQLREECSGEAVDVSAIHLVAAGSRQLFSSAVQLLARIVIRMQFDPLIVAASRTTVKDIHEKCKGCLAAIYPLDLQPIVCYLTMTDCSDMLIAESALKLAGTEDGRFKLKVLLTLCFPEQLSRVLRLSPALQTLLCLHEDVTSLTTLTISSLCHSLS